ncbi:hypothetical protein Musp01_05520 [Muricauda sp. NBRC 101325]|nr:hypothetical protein Musp01_05520 [Muricauda sp. NBRC 101325]
MQQEVQSQKASFSFVGGLVWARKVVIVAEFIDATTLMNILATIFMEEIPCQARNDSSC